MRENFHSLDYGFHSIDFGGWAVRAVRWTLYAEGQEMSWIEKTAHIVLTHSTLEFESKFVCVKGGASIFC